MKHDEATKVPRKLYEAELQRLQAELVSMKEWVRSSGERLLVVFEGRDAAGKGGAIKRVSEYLNPRTTGIVALPAPTEGGVAAQPRPPHDPRQPPALAPTNHRLHRPSTAKAAARQTAASSATSPATSTASSNTHR